MLGKQLLQKVQTVRYKVRARTFKQTPAWTASPDNRDMAPVRLPELEQAVRDACRSAGARFEELRVTPAEFEAFVDRFRLPPMSLYALRVREKKQLEHLIAARLLDLSPGQRYVDIASESSPFPEIFGRVLGVEAYSQDLTYPAGIRGRQIGSSADTLPVPDAWMDGASLQCAFEHFQGDIDRNFIRELARTLKPGGRCVIVPLYMNNEPYNVYDPILYSGWKPSLADAGATVVAELELGGHFERVYAPGTLDRILIPGLGLDYTVFAVRGHDEIVKARGIAPRGAEQLRRVRFALLVRKPA